MCGDQVVLYNEFLPEFRRLNAVLLRISVDGDNALAAARHVHFPRLADFEPKGAVAKLYGAYRIKDGITERALFVLGSARNFMSGARSGANGTPTFFVNGIRHDGPWDVDSLGEALMAAAHVHAYRSGGERTAWPRIRSKPAR